MATDRSQISGKIRFEVFKRDGFKCQYCGSAAPDVILHVDHVRPLASDGDNDIGNLITACAECNLGKGPRELSDRSAIEKQRKQPEELNERRLQLEMMIEWREGLGQLEAQKIEALASLIERVAGCGITDTGRDNVRKCHALDDGGAAASRRGGEETDIVKRQAPARSSERGRQNKFFPLEYTQLPDRICQPEW